MQSYTHKSSWKSTKTILPAKENRSLEKQEMARGTMAKVEKTWILTSLLLSSAILYFLSEYLSWGKNSDGFHSNPVEALPSPAFPPRFFSPKSKAQPS